MPSAARGVPTAEVDRQTSTEAPAAANALGPGDTVAERLRVVVGVGEGVRVGVAPSVAEAELEPDAEGVAVGGGATDHVTDHSPEAPYFPATNT